MIKWIALPVALAVAALLGTYAHDDLMASGMRYNEISPSIASELVGGVDCEHYGPMSCGATSTPDCPLSLGYEKRLSLIPPGKPSGSVWCGCNTDCTGQFMVKGLFACGS